MQLWRESLDNLPCRGSKELMGLPCRLYIYKQWSTFKPDKNGYKGDTHMILIPENIPVRIITEWLRSFMIYPCKAAFGYLRFVVAVSIRVCKNSINYLIEIDKSHISARQSLQWGSELDGVCVKLLDDGRRRIGTQRQTRQIGIRCKEELLCALDEKTKWKPSNWR